jgi:hypothetical protein
MNVLIEADRKPNAAGAYGHHGIWLARGGNNLVTDFTVNASQVGCSHHGLYSTNAVAAGVNGMSDGNKYVHTSARC